MQSLPHAGYHYANRPGRFEGWYSRITTELGSFAVMVALENPRTAAASGMVQVLGRDDQLLWRSIPGEHTWIADSWQIALGHSSPQVAYCLMADHHSGFLTTPQGDRVRWQYQITPRYTFGTHEATMGWLGYLPPGLDRLTDPGWQILMALGWASGWFEWQGQRYTFERAPAYAEKNWGNAFPSRWFWLQANAFSAEPDLALTCAGGVRDLLGRAQTVALISIHWQGRHICFRPGASQIRWQLSEWGTWHVWAETEGYRLALVGETDLPGTWVLVPTAAGQAWHCRDTTQGKLRLQLWDDQHCLLDCTTTQAGLEMGGNPITDWVSHSE